MPTALIVDDNEAMARAIAQMVTLLDWDAQVVLGPRSAIQAINRLRPTLILLDLNMPGIDGKEILKFVRRDPMLSGTAVVFVSAEDDPVVVQALKAAGALDYLVKPVELDQLEAVLHKIKPPAAR
jgi:CheY-like chemotaxis protein